MEHATPALLLLMFLFVAPVLIAISRAKKGWTFYVRRIAGIDAIDDVIGRAVELGRPLSFTTGITSLSPLLYACLGAMRYVARKSALFSKRLFVPCSDPQALVLSEATVQTAYIEERKFSEYDPSMMRFLSEEQFAFASGYQGLIHRENVGGAFLFGAFAAESLILAEAGQQIGAQQVAATTSPEQVPFFITACDYTLIGEELYAAGAYLSEDPVQVGSLRGQDIVKLILLAVLCLGVFQATLLSAKYPQIEFPEQNLFGSSSGFAHFKATNDKFLFEPNKNAAVVKWINNDWSDWSKSASGAKQ